MGDARDRTFPYTTARALADYIRTLTNDDLDEPAPNLPEHLSVNRQAAFVHLLSHEAYHIGKLGLLRKLLDLRTISEQDFGSSPV